MKALSVIGYHHSGKTTLVTTIIRQLKQLGYRVVSAKDIHAEDYHVDTAGKNTALHTSAGSEAVFAKGLHDSALLFPTSLSLKEIITYLQADFLIIEGMRDAPVPKIICASSTAEWDELIDGTTIGLSGLIAGQHQSHQGLPVFCLRRDTKALMDTILSKCFEILPLSDPECCSACGKDCYHMAVDIVQGKAKRSDCALDGKPELKLVVDGRGITLVPFVQKLLKDNILAFISNLKDTDPSGDIHISITR